MNPDLVKTVLALDFYNRYYSKGMALPPLSESPLLSISRAEAD